MRKIKEFFKDIRNFLLAVYISLSVGKTEIEDSVNSPYFIKPKDGL